jgi:hypothetical protein
MKVGKLENVSKGDFLKITWLGLDEKVDLGSNSPMKKSRKMSAFYIIGQVRDIGIKTVRRATSFAAVPMLSFEILFSSYGYVKKGDEVEINILKINRDLLLNPIKRIQNLIGGFPDWRVYYVDVEPISKEQALIYEL